MPGTRQSAEYGSGVASLTAAGKPLCDRGGVEMTNVSEEGQIFECGICGNVVEVKEVGGGELVCCGEPMALQEV